MQKQTRSSADIYQYSFDPNSDSAGANVLRLVGHNKSVLELGAGPGSIARLLVEINKCNVTAVERDGACAALLKNFCSNVHQLDLNEPEWPKIFEGRQFENIVIADVLEHLHDPWATLERALPLLRDDGSFVVSLPHVGHASVMACLLDNDFEYRDCGLLDRTHIRFFGIKNIQLLFEEAGLKIADFAFVVRKPEQTEFAKRWATLPSHTKTMLQSADFGNVFQVVLRAERNQLRPTVPGKVLLDHSPTRHHHNLKFIAFYLPQFHPIPENDEWWGEGFTEWTNTSKAQPLFPGHYQPHVPSDLGFYDLRLREVQHEQIAMARQYGIDAFCFHYYWFNGRRLLERPVEEFLKDEKADIEFCLCWANESWSRRWNGSEDDLLIKQEYSLESDVDFINSVIPYFKDRRYLRIDDKPALVVYRPQQIPTPERAAQRWRDRCREAGIGEIHLIAALTFDNSVKRPDFLIEELGYDSGVEFPPHGRIAPNISKRLLGDVNVGPQIIDYSDLANQYLALDHSQRRVFRGVVPSWDNTPRRKELSLVLLNADPDKYERWLHEAALKTILERLPSERLVFINAWNEWAEGCHLEPDQRFGKGFLEATSRVKLWKSAAAPLPLRPSEQASIGLRAELRRWGMRTFQHIPFAWSVARAVYRTLIKR